MKLLSAETFLNYAELWTTVITVTGVL